MPQNKFIDQETGEEFVQTEDGQMVLSVQGGSKAVAAGIGSGLKDVMLIPKGGLQLTGGFLSAIGADAVGDPLQEAGAVIGESRDRMRSDFELSAEAEFPYSFMAGEMLGSFRPGAPGVQAGIGVAEGVGLAETPEQAAIMGTMGLLGGFGGGKGGNRALQRAEAAIAARSSSAARAARSEAAERLRRLNIPLQESDQATRGATGPVRRDRLRQLLNPDAAIRDKRSALNGLISESIHPQGGAQDAFTSGWLTDVSNNVDELYTGVRNQLPIVTETTGEAGERALNAAVRMEGLAAQVSPSRSADVKFWSDKVTETWQAGELTPQRWSTLRSNIATSARSADNAETMSNLYEIRSLLDEMVTGNDPAVRAALAEANNAFRFKEVLIRPHVIDQTGDINPNQFLRNMEKMFPQSWKTDYTANPLAGELVDTLRAAEQFPAFRTSGTGEMLTAGSIAKQVSARAQLALGSPGSAIGGTLGRSLMRPAELTFDAFKNLFGEDSPTDEPQSDAQSGSAQPE